MSLSLSDEIEINYCDVTFMRILMAIIKLFRRFSQNCEKRLLTSSCPSVRPRGKIRLPLDGFS